MLSCSVMWSDFVDQLYFLLKFHVSRILQNITVILAQLLLLIVEEGTPVRQHRKEVVT